MKKQFRRRDFLGNMARGVAGAGLVTAAACSGIEKHALGGFFIHHVFFWLKEPVTTETRSRFETALKKLVTVETIVDYHLGVPAPTDRGVIDTTYSYSLLTIFRNKEDQDIYQTHPTHLKFIEDCEELWERVVVYDTISI